MADLADLAGEIADEHLAHTLENRQQYNAESEFECLECGCQIPEQRRALGGVTLCIDCQTVVEIQNKQYR